MVERHQARLLVIDDDPAVRSVLCELLSGLGYAVDEAPGGPGGWPSSGTAATTWS